MEHHICLVANTSWYIYNFRLPLLRQILDSGYRLTVIAPYDTYTPLLEQEGFTVANWQVNRSSINPFAEIISIIHLVSLYRSLAPSLVHHFTIKACLYGTIAAKIARVYCVINAVTGLGHMFLGARKRNRLLRKLTKPLYRATLNARRSTVVFQNPSDLERLVNLGITSSSQTLLIKGSGIDIARFSPTNDTSGYYHTPVKLLFPSRLTKEKGIVELVDACKLLWSRNHVFELLLAGDLDLGNRSTISMDYLDYLRSQPNISFLGHIQDMPSLYESADIVVLPSWREGLSRALIEAASMERPIITTDVPGCLDVVDHGDTGLLVPKNDPHSLSLAITLLLNKPLFARSLGKSARRKVVKHFQVSHINQETLNQYTHLLATSYRDVSTFF